MTYKRWQKVVTTRPSKSIPGDDADESPKKLQSFWNLSFTFPQERREREMRHANILSWRFQWTSRRISL
jgi:hypothetical protein